uniref:FBD domain-containing protein n=1 Tax=Leersia perrieri TaxID=77586 RepID=A0A0D9X623_9ORYZ
MARIEKGTVRTLWYLNENPLEGITWKFHNLRISALTVNFGKMPSIMSIFSLLRCAPQIEILHIEVDQRETQNNGIVKEIIDVEMSDGLVKTLKCVIMSLVTCLPSEMSFIELLLSKATSLESLKVMYSWKSLMPLKEACTSFPTFKKASPHGSCEHNLLIWEFIYIIRNKWSYTFSEPANHVDSRWM